MSADNSRIQELRRRIQEDPASIAFAQLAEECRRAGEFQEAIAVCRNGLARYPGYHSARVTLGRALLALQRFDEARAEFELVVESAPDNLAAARGLSEIGQLSDAAPGDGKPAPQGRSGNVEPSPVAEPLFDLDRLLEQLDERARRVSEAPPPSPSEDQADPQRPFDALPQGDESAVMNFNDQALAELESRLADFERGYTAKKENRTDQPTLSELESWLGAIVAERRRRSVT